MAHFEIKNLSFSYPTAGGRKALDDISLTIERGQYVTFCGRSGCGKTTILRQLKSALTPHGKRTGQILFDGTLIQDVGLREQSARIGYVMQDPDNQIVTDKVWHELAFGLESLGVDQKTIRLRVAEMASYFGIQGWFHKKVTELSGGQKQLLNLASIMAMQPDVLILDEPTSQLDPIAASDFLNTVRKINRELRTTVLITEHRLEDIFHASDLVVVMEDGKVLAADGPRQIGAFLKEKESPIFAAMPSPVQIYFAVMNTNDEILKKRSEKDEASKKWGEEKDGIEKTFEEKETSKAAQGGRVSDRLGTTENYEGVTNVQNLSIGKNMDIGSGMGGASEKLTGSSGMTYTAGCPLTVREGAAWLDTLFDGKKLTKTVIEDADPTLTDPEDIKDPAVFVKETWFRYEKDTPDILKGVVLRVPRKTLFAVVGGNGTGKSTLLKTICNTCKPYRGKVLIDGKPVGKYKGGELFRHNLAFLPQDPKSLFVKKTVREELLEMLERGENESRIDEVAALCEITPLLAQHPYDLSGGEQQRAALAKVLLTDPKILLLDEPTKGIDSFFKQQFAEILKKLKGRGVTIIMVSHDVEFCAKYADLVSMFFDGSVVTTNTPNQFFSRNSFYTTAANRMSRHVFENAVNNEDVIKLCKENL